MKKIRVIIISNRSLTILVLIALQFLSTNICAQAQGDTLNYDESKIYNRQKKIGQKIIFLCIIQGSEIDH